MAQPNKRPYDPSLDYARYPTLAPLPRPVARCKGCGGSAFEFLLPQWKPLCKRCGQELALPGSIEGAAVPSLDRTEIQFCSSYDHTILLRSDGTVRGRIHSFEPYYLDGHLVSGPPKDCGQCEVQDWDGITAIAIGDCNSFGLRKDGTVLAVGRNDSGQCKVQDWSGITAIAAGVDHTVGLRKDGTVLAAGSNRYGQCNVQSWYGITAIAAGDNYTVGLRKDGTVVATGRNHYGQCNVQSWSGITAIATGSYHTVGLRKDGTVAAIGRNDLRQCHSANWSGITAIVAQGTDTIGLRRDGTVISAFSAFGYSDWTNITRIMSGYHFTAMTADGAIVCEDPETQKWLRENLD